MFRPEQAIIRAISHKIPVLTCGYEPHLNTDALQGQGFGILTF